MTSRRKRERPAVISLLERKWRKVAYEAERQRSKIYIDAKMERWNALKGKENLRFHHKVTRFLLDIPLLFCGFVFAVGYLLYSIDTLDILNIQYLYNQPPPKAVIRVHYYNRPEWVSPDVFQNCDDNCVLTWGSDFYNDSGVVLFHGPYIHATTNPPKKLNGQIWVFHSKESPANRYTKFLKWKSLFNWTMTYQRDADVLAVYGRFIKKSEIKGNFEHPKSHIPVNNYSVGKDWTSKENKAAWFVTNCRTASKREIFVKTLSNHVDIDIYGVCGKYRCYRSKELNCMEILRKTYKMYLSFENSLCRDYITEKSFKIYEHFANVIPITRGVGNQYSLFLPPRSFINTNKFTSVKQLGEHLKQVMRNKEQFYKYFKWRKYYSTDRHFPHEFCDLCRKLHEGPEKYQRIYEDVGFFFNGETYKPYCHRANDIPII